MKNRIQTSGMNRHDSEASRREQMLCMDALTSGEFDDMSDNDWVALCERIAREASGKDDHKLASAASGKDDHSND